MVEIDDQIPVYPRLDWQLGDIRPRQLMSAHSKVNGEFWVSLFEKGFLRLYSEYDSHELSFDEAVHAFCQWIPNPQFEINTIWKYDFEWKRFVRQLKTNKILVPICTIEGRISESQNLGLIANQGYAVIDAFQCGNTKLLKIRNPHGTDVWRGNFNSWDNKNWTKELQKQV
ncbi:MAG: hypothetical protein EZS28_027931 [Streblomastix strix]|uniref:Calpain catalytic domain-containing protein n=1 Tax=Streblomastix strix TaxID=222440 RepID=A0A5J4V3B9_9EUKA|nr:MAG: hypothetical protein EZS28_027931 [Streblomastix strix]